MDVAAKADPYHDIPCFVVHTDCRDQVNSLCWWLLSLFISDGPFLFPEQWSQSWSVPKRIHQHLRMLSLLSPTFAELWRSWRGPCHVRLNLIKLLDQCLLNHAQTLTESANFLLLSCGRTGMGYEKGAFCQRVTPITCTVAPCVLCCWPNHLIHVTITRLTPQRFHPDKAGGCGVMLLGLFVDSNDHWPNDVMSHLSHHWPSPLFDRLTSTSTWYPSSPIQWCPQCAWEFLCSGGQGAIAEDDRSPMICVKPLPETSRHIVMQAWLPPSTTRMEPQAVFFYRFFVAPQYVQDRRIEAISFASTQNNSRNFFISSTHFLQLR